MIKIKCEELGELCVEIIRLCIYLVPVTTMGFTVIFRLFLDVNAFVKF